jgi:hypothetical protein
MNQFLFNKIFTEFSVLLAPTQPNYATLELKRAFVKRQQKRDSQFCSGFETPFMRQYLKIRKEYLTLRDFFSLFLRS